MTEFERYILWFMFGVMLFGFIHSFRKRFIWAYKRAIERERNKNG